MAQFVHRPLVPHGTVPVRFERRGTTVLGQRGPVLDGAREEVTTVLKPFFVVFVESFLRFRDRYLVDGAVGDGGVTLDGVHREVAGGRTPRQCDQCGEGRKRE